MNLMFLRVMTCILSALILVSCGTTGGQVKVQKNEAYKVHTPGPPWERLTAAQIKLDADHAFVKPSTGSTLYLRSECHLYKDASLKQLSMGLRRLFQHVSVIERKQIQLVNRDALRTVFKGSMDGVQVNVNSIVLKKHSCYFDFVLIALPETYAQDVPVFNTFVNSFSL